MINVEVKTGNIAGSGCAAIIDRTFLPGGEEELKAYEAADAVIRVEGPEWTEENKTKGAEFYRAVLSVLEEARDRGLKEIDITSAAAGESGSELFLAATQAMTAVKYHMTENELPETVRFICPREEVTNMYKTAYNYWLAIDHDSRMEVPHRHD